MRARALVLLLATACGNSGPLVDWEPTDSAAWRGSAATELVAVRAALEGGDLDGARTRLAIVLLAEPNLLTGRFLLQELDLAAPGADQAAFAAAARARAAVPGAAPIEFLLAARLEPDPAAARLLLQGAMATAVSPDFEAACRYALAYLAFQDGDAKAARNALAASLALDPGAFRARRLEARLEAKLGDTARAEILLAHWLDLSESAPEVGSEVWYAALVELAALRVALDDRGGAQDALERLALPRFLGAYPAAQDGARADGLFVAAALDAEAGEPEAALQKVRAARELVSAKSRGGRLAMVDEALLDELFLDRELDASAAWRAVLERFEGAGAAVDLDELMRALEARVRLARLEAKRPK